DVIAVPLEAGVEEYVRPAAGAGGSFETLGFEFDRAAGWDRTRAGEWARKHLGLCDLGRTVFLDRPHRMRGKLAGSLAGVLAGEELPACPERRPAEDAGPGAWGRWAAPLELVPVPPAAPAEPRRRGGETRPRPQRGGAGFGLGPSDSAHPQHLPSGLRALLPRRGLVNYFEAQAVVQALEALVADASFRKDAAAWQERHAPSDPALAVAALYPAQAQLLRHLVGQSRALAQAGLRKLGEGRFEVAAGGRGLALWVDVPEALRPRECRAPPPSL